jgi:hypothetical protein
MKPSLEIRLHRNQVDAALALEAFTGTILAPPQPPPHVIVWAVTGSRNWHLEFGVQNWERDQGGVLIFTECSERTYLSASNSLRRSDAGKEKSGFMGIGSNRCHGSSEGSSPFIQL